MSVIRSSLVFALAVFSSATNCCAQDGGEKHQIDFGSLQDEISSAWITGVDLSSKEIYYLPLCFNLVDKEGQIVDDFVRPIPTFIQGYLQPKSLQVDLDRLRSRALELLEWKEVSLRPVVIKRLELEFFVEGEALKTPMPVVAESARVEKILLAITLQNGQENAKLSEWRIRATVRWQELSISERQSVQSFEKFVEETNRGINKVDLRKTEHTVRTQTKSNSVREAKFLSGLNQHKKVEFSSETFGQSGAQDGVNK